MRNLYNCINNTEYLKSKIANCMCNNSDNSNPFKREFICDTAIKRISDCIVDYIQGNYNLENETVYTEISNSIINNILKYGEKFNIKFIVSTFKCYRKVYVDLVLQEGLDDKSKLEITNYTERFLIN